MPTSLFPALGICIYSIFPVDPFIRQFAVLIFIITLASTQTFTLPGDYLFHGFDYQNNPQISISLAKTFTYVEMTYLLNSVLNFSIHYSFSIFPRPFVN